MKEIFDFIEDACCALDLLSRYYRISYDESKIVYSEGGYVIEDGETEELGWGDSDIYSMVAKEDGSRFTFNDACEQLIDKYVESIGLFSEDNKPDGKYYASLIEAQFLKIDETQRKALIKKIVRSSFIFLMPSSYPLYKIIQPNNTYGVFAYRCFMSDEEIEEYEKKDEIGMYKALPIISWLIEECCTFFNTVGTLCSDYDINLLELAKSVFPYTILPLRFDVFDDELRYKKNHEKEDITESKTNTPDDKTQKLGAPSVKVRILLIKVLMEQVYSGFGKLDDTVQMRFINSLTGIDKNAKNISNGSIKPAFNAIKEIENGLDTEGKAIDSYNKTIDEASFILESIGVEKLSNELKKKKIS